MPRLSNIRGLVGPGRGAATIRRAPALKLDGWYTPGHHLTAERIKKVLMNRPSLLAETASEIRGALMKR